MAPIAHGATQGRSKGRSAGARGCTTNAPPSTSGAGSRSVAREEARSDSTFLASPGSHRWVPLTSFVGRGRELDELQELVAAHRLVTMLGPGGTGKTRLAMALCDRIESDVVFVELASIREARLAPSVIARMVGIPMQADRSAMGLVVEHFATSPSLLVLDNLEQLDGMSMVISELLARCPGMRVLATSRRPLRIGGERRYNVQPLAIPVDGEHTPDALETVESVELFLQRARHVDPTLETSDETVATAAAICRRLEGLPLAIELAAARVGLLSPAALLRRLDDRLGELTDGPVDAPARQATLRSTIEWSHDLLGPDEQRAFSRASVLVGGFSEAAAKAVMVNPGEPEAWSTRTLATLVEHSLLMGEPDANGEPRFHMLETIREFATERLSDGGPVARRHAEYFADLTEASVAAMEGPDQGAWAHRVAQDIDNIRAALAWASENDEPETCLRLATAMGRWSFMGNVREARRWLDSALRSGLSVSPRLRARALRTAAVLAADLADTEAHQRLIGLALDVSEGEGDGVGIAESYLVIGNAALNRGAFDAARTAMAHALEAAAKAGEAALIEKSKRRLAIASAGKHGDEPEALKVLESSTGVLRQGSNERELGMTLVNLAFAYLVADHPAEARTTISEAEEILERLGERSVMGTVAVTAGMAELRLGRPRVARERILAGISNTAEVGHVGDMLYALEAAAEWLGSTGGHRDAVVLWSASDKIRFERAIPIQPIDRSWIERGRQRDELRLRPDRSAAAREEGAALVLEAALTRARVYLRGARVEAPAHTAASSEERRFRPTPRELEVLTLLVDGMSDGAIAERLFISRKTASVHVANLKGKLGASSRVEIATMAIREGLATPTDEADV